MNVLAVAVWNKNFTILHTLTTSEASNATIYEKELLDNSKFYILTLKFVKVYSTIFDQYVTY